MEIAVGGNHGELTGPAGGLMNFEPRGGFSKPNPGPALSGLPSLELPRLVTSDAGFEKWGPLSL